MGLFDRFQGKKGALADADDAQDLPSMDSEPLSLAEAAQQKHKFRARENEASVEQENEGLPSVNRFKTKNRLTVIAGAVAVICAASALIAGVNRDPAPKQSRRPQAENIANKLPPFVMPAEPPPIAVAAVAKPEESPVPPLAQGTPPVAPLGVIPNRANPNAKPPMDWSDRKMGGALLVGGDTSPTNMPAAVSPAAIRAEGSQPSSLLGGPTRGPSNEFASRLEPTIMKGVSAALLPDRNFLITKGTTLDCALETALDSTLPGITTCRLTRDIYSDNGQVLLLDRGSQLVGEYQGGVKQGQVRLFVLWTRAKTPNGVVVSLNSPSTDALGRSGLEGWVDNHFLERFGAAILMSLIKDSVSAIARGGSGGSTTNVYGNSASGGERVVEKILDSTVNIPPTLVKNQGEHVQVMVARDLDFSSVYALQVKE